MNYQLDFWIPLDDCTTLEKEIAFATTKRLMSTGKETSAKRFENLGHRVILLKNLPEGLNCDELCLIALRFKKIPNSAMMI